MTPDEGVYFEKLTDDMFPTQIRATKPTHLVDFPISISPRDNFRIQGVLFGIRKGSHPKHAKGLYYFDKQENDVVMLSGLFWDSEGEDWVRYSGDIKAYGRRYFFKIRLVGDVQVFIEDFQSFWEGFQAFIDRRDQLPLTESQRKQTRGVSMIFDRVI